MTGITLQILTGRMTRDQSDRVRNITLDKYKDVNKTASRKRLEVPQGRENRYFWDMSLWRIPLALYVGEIPQPETAVQPRLGVSIRLFLLEGEWLLI